MAKHNFDDSTAELAHDIVENAQELVRLEVALAKQELKELAISNAVAAGAFAAAGLLAMIAILVALPVLIVVLVPQPWIAALVWLVLYLLLAGALALFGRSRLRIELPQRTISSLRETKAWALRQLSTSGR
jgi:hypothetical protein